MQSEDLYLGVECLSRGVCGTSQGIVLYRRGMILESLDDRHEIWIANSRYLFIPLIHQLNRYCPFCLPVEDTMQFHRQLVGMPENGIVPEKYVDTVTLYVIPFIVDHHRRMFTSCQDLAHDLSVGVCLRCL